VAKECSSAIFCPLKKKEVHDEQILGERLLVSKINMQDGLGVDHIAQFQKLWVKVNLVLLDESIPDTIVWNLSSNGCYSSKSAY
jgi:hypothetical protein